MKKAKKKVLDIGFVDHDKLHKSEQFTTIGFIGLGLSAMAIAIGDIIRTRNVLWAKPMDETANETNKKLFDMLKNNPNF